MTVNLATEVGLEATAPDPVPDSRAAIAPTLGEEVAPDAETQPSEIVPDATPETPPPPTPRTTTTTPRAQPTTTPRQNRRTPPTPRATPSPRPTNRGGSRIGENFLPGQGGSTRTDETRIPASQIGASAKASIIQDIGRQLRPHWQGKAPSGADAEKLVTILAFKLNKDGSLKGRPRVVRQSGVTPSNEAQKARHAEIAIRAVQLAAPFDLPDEYYEAWKNISAWRFDRRL